MRLILYSYEGEQNRLDKAGYLTSLLEVKGTLKNVTSVLTPTFLIDARDSHLIVDDSNQLVTDDDRRFLIDGTSMNDILNCNYVYCEDMSRYYFVTDIQVVNPSLFYLSCRVDVLMTYKDNIKEETAYVARNEKKHNALIPDNNEQLFSNYSVSYNPIVNRDDNDVNFEFNIEKITGTNVILNIIVQGKDDWSPKTIIPPSSLQMLNYVPSDSLDLKNVSHPFAISRETSMSVVQSMLENDATGTFIKSIYVTPFAIDTQYNPDTKKNINPFQEEISEPCYVYDFYSRTSDYLIVADFVPPSPTSYLDLEPYQKYSIYVPFYGYVDLDLNKIGGKRVILYYIFDWLTGEGQAYISEVNSVYNNVIWTQPVNALIKIDLSSTNAYENEISRKNNVIGTALGVLTSGINIATGVATGNPFGVAKGITGVGKSIASAVTNEMSIMEKGNVGYSSQYLNCFSNLKPYIRVMKRSSANNINKDDYTHTFGLPLFKQYTLKDLEGFTLVNDCILKKNYNTSTEKNEVYNLLRNGIII